MDNKKTKSRLSFVLRDSNEFSHSKGINAVVLGKSYEKLQPGKFEQILICNMSVDLNLQTNLQDVDTTIRCRELFSAGRDGKIRLWEAQHSMMEFASLSH